MNSEIKLRYFLKRKTILFHAKVPLMQSAREVNMLEIYSFWTIQYRDKLSSNSANLWTESLTHRQSGYGRYMVETFFLKTNNMLY